MWSNNFQRESFLLSIGFFWWGGGKKDLKYKTKEEKVHRRRIIYRVRKKWCESFEESPYVIWLTHPPGSLLFNSTNVLANREKKNFCNISKNDKTVN